MSTLSILNMNVQSLKNEGERVRLFTSIASRRYDLILMTKTRCTTLKEQIEWKSELLTLNFESTSEPGNNTAILWNKSSHFFASKTPKIIKININPEGIDAEDYEWKGRVSMISFAAGSESILLVCCYAPNLFLNQKVFFKKLHTSLMKKIRSSTHEHRSLILSGDFNCVENPQLDSSNSEPSANPLPQSLISLLQSQHLQDSFRLLHPTSRQFTNNTKTASLTQRRLDRIYISDDLRPDLVSSQRLPRIKRSHNPMDILLCLAGLTSFANDRYRLPANLFDRPAMAELFSEMIKDEMYPLEGIAADGFLGEMGGDKEKGG